MTDTTTTDTRPTIAPTDIAPTAVKHLRSYADWLTRRRHDDLWVRNDLAEPIVELRLTEIERLITGLHECADGLEFLASITRVKEKRGIK
jgi:hypothetical protein